MRLLREGALNKNPEQMETRGQLLLAITLYPVDFAGPSAIFGHVLPSCSLHARVMDSPLRHSRKNPCCQNRYEVRMIREIARGSLMACETFFRNFYPRLENEQENSGIMGE